MYGWRGRIGLLLPTGNCTNEAEWWRMAPEGVSIHSARVQLKDVTKDSLADMINYARHAAEDIAMCEVGVAAFACTSGSFVGGPGYDWEIIKIIEEAAGCPATTTTTAVVNALKAVKARKVVLATPYLQEINDLEKAFLEAHGFEIVKMKGLGLKELKDIMNQRPETAYRLAKGINTDTADTIFISCTGFRTIEIIKALEDDTGKSVVTSNQATFAECLKILGVKADMSAYGSLFEYIWNI